MTNARHSFTFLSLSSSGWRLCNFGTKLIWSIILGPKPNTVSCVSFVNHSIQCIWNIRVSHYISKLGDICKDPVVVSKPFIKSLTPPGEVETILQRIWDTCIHIFIYVWIFVRDISYILSVKPKYKKKHISEVSSIDCTNIYKYYINYIYICYTCISKFMCMAVWMSLNFVSRYLLWSLCSSSA